MSKHTFTAEEIFDATVYHYLDRVGEFSSESELMDALNEWLAERDLDIYDEAFRAGYDAGFEAGLAAGRGEV